MPIAVLNQLGWRWALNGGAVQHLVPPHPGPLARTYCGEPLRDIGGIPSTLFDTAACRRCQKRAGLA